MLAINLLGSYLIATYKAHIPIKQVLASFVGHVGGGKWPGGEAKMSCIFTPS